MRQGNSWKPTREELLRAFKQTPPTFDAAIDQTLRCLMKEKEEKVMKRKLPLALAVALVVVLLSGIAVYAAMNVRTVDRFGESYGEDMRKWLEAGDTAEIGLSRTLGDVVYTVTDVVYADGVLYGTAVITPADGANLVLIPEDYNVTDPAGYAIYEGERAPEGAKTYAQVAAQKGAKICLAKCLPEGYVVDGELLTGDIGYFFTPLTDGSILVSFEVYGQGEAIFHADSYTLRLHLSNWEVTAEGEWLREEPNNTWLKDEWDVIVTPQPAQETQSTQEAPEEATAQDISVTDGFSVLIPESVGDTLPVYALTRRTLVDTVAPEWFNQSGVACEERQEQSVLFVFNDDDRLYIDDYGGVWYNAYSGTREQTYENAETGELIVEVIPAEETEQQLANLAFQLYWDGVSDVPYEEPAAQALESITLSQARETLDALLEKLGVTDAAPVWVYAMDAAHAAPLNQARTQEIESGLLMNSVPYDLSDLSSRKEGYAFVYQSFIDGVSVSTGYLQIHAFVTATGVRYLSMTAPYILGDVTIQAQPLIPAQDALAAAIKAVQSSRLADDLCADIAAAQSAELIYRPLASSKQLVPAWRIHAVDSQDHWPYEVDISAVDASLIDAPWL